MYHRLWAIGGFYRINMERIGINNTFNRTWEMMSETFPTTDQDHLRNPAVVQHDDCILVIGGTGGAYEMELRNVWCVDTGDGSISDAGWLTYSVSRSAFIKIDYTIYLFGGIGGLPVLGNDDYVTMWQYYTLPTPGPTYEPTKNPTADPTGDPTADPTSDPTNDPTSEPTVEPTTDPTADPTRDPTIEPTRDPTRDPTAEPTAAPTDDPSSDPTNDPTVDPTTEPTKEPTQSPTHSPTQAPSQSPLGLFQLLERETDPVLEDSAEVILYSAIGVGAVIVCCAVVLMQIRRASRKRMSVDDQDYLAVLLYIAQIVDILSDLVFSLQCRAYWLYEDEDPNDVVEKGTFSWIYHCALGFTIAPYLMNLFSSINITRKISDDGMVSTFTKQYFQDNSHIYTVLVLLSGGSFRALSLMNSNLFGLRKLSAGLSTLQLQRFQSHHVIATVFAENIPQIALQYYFMFKLGLPTTIAMVSFGSSIFNIFLTMMNVAVFYILNRDRAETPFTILLTWRYCTCLVFHENFSKLTCFSCMLIFILTSLTHHVS